MRNAFQVGQGDSKDQRATGIWIAGSFFRMITCALRIEEFSLAKITVLSKAIPASRFNVGIIWRESANCSDETPRNFGIDRDIQKRSAHKSHAAGCPRRGASEVASILE